MEKCETQSQFGALRILLDSHSVHSLKLFKKLDAVILHLVLSVSFLFLQILRKRTVLFSAYFLMFFDVSDQKHVTVLIFLLVFNQLKYVSYVAFKLLTVSELQV